MLKLLLVLTQKKAEGRVPVRGRAKSIKLTNIFHFENIKCQTNKANSFCLLVFSFSDGVRRNVLSAQFQF